MRITLVLCLLLFITISCRKDDLDGDKEIFAGKWKWDFTIRYYNGVGGYQDTIFSSLSADTYQLEFLEKGIMNWYKNNEKIEKYRVIFNYWELGVNGNAEILNYYKFSMELPKDEIFFGYLNRDTLITSDVFPFERTFESGIGIIYVSNFFMRE